MTIPGSTAQTLDAEWSPDLLHARISARQLVSRSYEQSAISFEEYAAKVVRFACEGQERARRGMIRRRKLFLRDAWGPILVSKLGNWVTPAVMQLVVGQHRDNIDLSRNPAKRVWSELSVLYKLPPQRTTEKAEDAERYKKLVQGTGFDAFWQLVELLLVTCNEVVIWPTVVEIDGKKLLKHKVAAGDTITAVPLADEPTEIECWCVVDSYTDLDGKDHTKYRLWTASWHGEFIEGKHGLERTDKVTLGRDDEPGDFTVVNPYGELPQVRIRVTDWQDIAWDSTTGEDLIDLTLQLGVARLFRRYHQKMSGFKQAVMTGNFDKEDRQILDPGYAIKLSGDDANVTQMDWQLDLKTPLECEEMEERAAAASRGINPGRWAQSTQYNTGIGALHAERGLAEHRIRFHPILAEAEAAYYRKLVVVCRAHGWPDDELPDADARLAVNHQQIAYPQDPRVQSELEMKEIQMGLESQLTIMMRRNPSWTREYAEEQLKERMDEIAAFQRMKVTANVPNDPSVESASAEENGRRGPIVRDDQPGSQPGDADSER